MARPRSFVRGKRRTPTWIGPADQSFISVATGAKVLISSISFAEPTTVARTRGEVSLHPEVVGADLSIDGAFGECVVSSDALAVGITAIPGPFSDPGWDGWLQWQSFAKRFEFGTAVGINFDAAWSYQVDSKAMRKIPAESVLVQVAESNAGAFKIAMHTRVLVLLV